MATSLMDLVYLRGLRFELCVGPDAWGRIGKPQTVVLSLQIEPEENLEAAASGDDVSRTLDYGKLYKNLTARLVGTQYENCEYLFEAIRHTLLPVRSLQMQLHLPKVALQLGGGLLYSLSWPSRLPPREPRLYDCVQTLRGITCSCIVGVNPHERLEKQVVGIDVEYEQAGVPLSPVAALQHQHVVRTVAQRVEGSSFLTVEALASAIAQTVIMNYCLPDVTVRVEKPNAIATIEAAGVQIHRRRSFFENKDFWQMRS